MNKIPKDSFAHYFSSFIFGVEDSLVSTVGLLSGVAVAGVTRSEIFVTGVILIFVEAFSMGVGNFLSENFADEFVSKKSNGNKKSVLGAIIMFISYFMSGFIPLFPYIIWEVNISFAVSILCSLIALFILGAISAKYFKGKIFVHGLKMFLIGGMAILAGIMIGQLLQLKS